MKELKFRAWNQTHNQMWIGNTGHIDLSIDFNGSLTCSDRYYLPLDDFIIMQYTGLKDCNDKEIYEKDIIKVNATNDIHVVEWDYFELAELSRCSYRSITVIGNIYENPDLLKEL